MPRQSVPAYCLHRGTGQAYLKIDGRRHYLGIYGSAESHKAYAAKVAEWQATQTSPPKKITVGQLTVLYARHCEQHYVKNGQQTSEVQGVRDALKRLNRLYRKELAGSFSPTMLRAVRERMIKEGLARNTINRAIGRIRRMFRWAVSHDLVHALVLTALETVTDLQYGRSQAKETKPVPPVTDAAVEAIRPFVSRQVWGIIQFQRATGARPGEALIVRGCDLDRTRKIWEYRPESHKTQHHGQERVIFVGPKGQKVLKEFLTDDPERYLFSPREAMAEMIARKKWRAGATVRKGIGERYSIHSLSAAITRASGKAGVEHWSANQLRHSFATLARKEAGIEAARVTLGHSSAVTSEIYAERDYEQARKIVARIG